MANKFVKPIPAVGASDIEIAEYIESAILNNDGGETFGIRVITDINKVFKEDFLKKKGIKFVSKTPKIGDTLENSWTWVDGALSREELKGTSTLGLDIVDSVNVKNKVKIIDNEIKRLKKEYLIGEGDLVFVKGNSSMVGFDKGESIIEDAKVLFTWKAKEIK